MKKRIVTLLVMFLFLLPCGKVFGSIPVIDAANLSRNAVTSIQMVQDVAHQVTQIQNQIQQYQAMLQSLESLDANTFNQVRVLLDMQSSEFNQIFSNVDAIGYGLSSIDSQFNQLFPPGADWHSIDSAQFEQYYQKWDGELTESAKTAMEAQSAVQRTQQYNNEIASILGRSQGASGEVRQLQANNQMIGVLSQQLGDLTGSIAATGRVSATIAAKAAAEQEASRQLNKRASTGYGGGRTTPQLRDLP